MNKQIRRMIAALALSCAGVKSAHAFPDVCTLANTQVPASIRVSSTELSIYQEKLRSECELSEKYQQMVLKAQKFGITLEQITEYQALRYVGRNYYEHARSSEIPVPVIYQILKADHLKEYSQRSSVIWDGFVIGIRQLENERSRIASGGTLELQDILRIHRNFYTLSDEVGDFSHQPAPGVLKPASPNDRYWWRLNANEVVQVTEIVRDVNATFADYGFANHRSDVLSVRQLEDGDYGIYGGDSRDNVANLQQLLNMLNEALAQARAGQHMVWNNRLVTPADVALLSQQRFVDIHPFYEGNGRTSRLIQELVLTLFKLPHGASGDLMLNDVLTRQQDYYRQAIAKTTALLASVDICLESSYTAQARANGANAERSLKGQSSTRVSEPVNASALNQAALEYNCRILK